MRKAEGKSEVERNNLELPSLSLRFGQTKCGGVPAARPELRRVILQRIGVT